MKAAVPFEVELTPALIARLRGEAGLDAIERRQLVRDTSYAGDEGGVVLHIEPDGAQRRLVISLTHVLPALNRT